MSDGTKTIFMIWEAADVQKGHIDKFVEALLSGSQYTIVRRPPESDGSVQLYVTGPTADIDQLIEAGLAAPSTVWLGADPAAQKETEHA